ncbi:MBL fold metallo-hydrolase [Ktedonosporobacter rubrisoli]|uniref:MBL fold metallo-hydrolase n=1 Tax=Ktedonosporobacter rubrisoli TaxID=2509675 RepID=A0A4P6JL63_KTERU|nr:MBL fold metallo-hydrolase [Ktedonosporobacter rubrisoli]QBD75396.1 MBL fold metallo-hydrolase [Ktedonosporobacter rubrisoli]
MNYIHTVVLPENIQDVEIEHASIRFIGTATVLLQYAGFTILTDPNFLHQGEQIHLSRGLRSTRLTNPAIELETLPHLDLVLLSHMHEDHFDRLVARKLPRGIPIVTTQQAATALRKMGFRKTYPLSTWQMLTIVKGESHLHITSLPAKHGPGLLAKLLPPVMGTLLEFETTAGKQGLRLYISGDTIMYKELKEIPKRYPEIDLALLHLGGTKVLGILLTMDSKQGIKAVRVINPREVIPIHYDDYSIFKSPLEDFQQAARQAKLEQRVRYLQPGELYTFEVPARHR